jgi:hypothetical protein
MFLMVELMRGKHILVDWCCFCKCNWDMVDELEENDVTNVVYVERKISVYA